MAQDSHNHLCGALEILLRAIFIRGFVVRRLVFLLSLADLMEAQSFQLIWMGGNIL